MPGINKKKKKLLKRPVSRRDDDEEEDEQEDESEDEDSDDEEEEGGGRSEVAALLKRTNRKLDEFRSNNRGLLKENKLLKKKMEAFDGIDPERLQAGLKALSKLDDEEDRKLVETGDIEALVGRRTKAMKTDYDTKISAKDKALNEALGTTKTLKNQLGKLINQNAVFDAIGETGFKPKKGARKDIIARINEDWHIDDEGNPVPGSEDEPIFGASGDPISHEEWTKEILIGKASHLFEGGSGGGSEGSGPAKPGKKKLDPNALSPREFGQNLEEIAGVKEKKKKS